MPYKDPEKARAAARESMRRKRANPAAMAEERRQKAIERHLVAPGAAEAFKAKHGHQPHNDDGFEG